MVGNGQTTEAEAVRQRLRERTERILRAARHHGFSVKGKIADKVRPCYLGPHSVPSTTEMASDVIAPGGQLGALLWRATSAVAHGQTHGLLSALWQTGFRSRCVARVIIWTEVRVRPWA
jgi:hypothetical protein